MFSGGRRFDIAALCCLATALVANAGDFPSPLPTFDFRKPEVVAEWEIVKHINGKRCDRQGMTLNLAGEDPHLIGPPRDYPPNDPLFAVLRLQAQFPGVGQIFYFERHATEEHSIRFVVEAGGMRDVVVPLPALRRGYRLRFDPPGSHGNVVVESLTIIPRPVMQPHHWPTPTVPVVDAATAKRLSSSQFEARFGDTWGAMQFCIGGELIATGHNRQEIGYHFGGKDFWFDLAKARVRLEKTANGVTLQTNANDIHGGNWTLRQHWQIRGNDQVDIESSLVVDQDRGLLHAPLIALMMGLGSHGVNKTQGLFAGLEYLDNEPSSSEADLTGPQANRRIPDASKITIPLMAIGNLGKFVALSWQPNADVAAAFDSPDRIWRSPAHVMSILAPGAEGDFRHDGEMLPFRPRPLNANKSLTAQATIFLGESQSPGPVAALRAYLARFGLPPLPTRPKLQQFVRQAALGWIDSGLREGDLYRHAVGPGFGPGPAADAAWMMRWLAATTEDSALATRLELAAAGAFRQVAAGSEYFANVGHLKHPVTGLVFNRVPATVQSANQDVANWLARFDADGVIRYRVSAKSVDFAKTHFSNEASGHAAQAVGVALKSALYSGNAANIRNALARLEKLSRYDHAVPRGAQTWEVPLHTPDIMASAHMAEAYSLGFEATGNAEYRRRAIEWAWTGVPFVYLRDPTAGSIGRYATTPVYGATHWKAPNWIGLPVQWCGLVYADALRRIERIDPGGPWKQLADGIVLSAIEQTYPIEHPRRGLLPDSFSLRSQQRNPADINPGTLLPLALPLLGGLPALEFTVKPGIYAPGRMELFEQNGPSIRFRFIGWQRQPQQLLFHLPVRSATATSGGKALSTRLSSLATGSTVLELPAMPRQPIDLAIEVEPPP